jgi:hypothetical protein
MCGEAFYRRYICGESTIPDLSLCIGGAMHSTQEAILYYFFDMFGTYPEKEHVREMAITELDIKIRKDGARYSKEEIKAGERATRDKADLLIGQMAIFWSENILPGLNPIDRGHVEKAFFLTIPGCELKLHGKIDVVEKKKIRDLKTGGTSDISQSDQFLAYSWWFKTHYGFMPEVVQDTIKKPDKRTKKITTKSFDYNPVSHTYNPKDFYILRDKLQLFERYVRQDIFLPATSYGWWCGEKCGFFDDCRYVYNPVQFAVTK